MSTTTMINNKKIVNNKQQFKTTLNNENGKDN